MFNRKHWFIDLNFKSVIGYLLRKLSIVFGSCRNFCLCSISIPGEEFTRGVRPKEAEEATSDLLKYMGRDPKYKKANGHNPSWLFTGLGLGKRSLT
jgi:hypothetical protein